jgi:hypothetical protein
MASPFPGMNPYLEHPDFWVEVHNRLIVAISDVLVPQVRPKYRVAIEKRIYQINQTDGDSGVLLGIPDVTVNRKPNDPDNQESTVAVAPPAEQPTTVTVPIPEQIKQAYLEVRDVVTGQVVTAIEILSPVNKRAGEGRETYVKKRQNMFGSLTHLIEIDLLRQWQPMPLLNNTIQSDYRVLISRQERRPQADLYAFNLPQPIPAFPIPLREGDREPVVDLQALLHQVYDRAGYDYTIDYSREPIPSLSEADTLWVNNLLQELQLR